MYAIQSNLKVAKKSFSTFNQSTIRQLFDKQLISYFEAYTCECYLNSITEDFYLLTIEVLVISGIHLIG
jgi:hypothetical protein